MDEVKSWRNTKAALTACGCVLLAGCAFHEVGLVTPIPAGARLETMDGGVYQLVLTGQDGAPLHYLDGHTADVYGTRVFHKVQVTDWKVIEGLHGMPAWIGVIEERGVQLGMLDRNSGAYYLLDRDAYDTLLPYVGQIVLVEGYVEGAQRVHVVYFRVLAGP